MTMEISGPSSDDLILLANLITSPDIFASLVNECGFGYFVPVSGTATLGMVGSGTEILNVPIVNPNYYRVLVLTGSINPSQPTISFTMQKDNINVLNLSEFNSFEGHVPNLYTPIRNRGNLSFTNISVVANVRVQYFFQTLQIQTSVWERLRTLFSLSLNASGSIAANTLRV